MLRCFIFASLQFASEAHTSPILHCRFLRGCHALLLHGALLFHTLLAHASLLHASLLYSLLLHTSLIHASLIHALLLQIRLFHAALLGASLHLLLPLLSFTVSFIAAQSFAVPVIDALLVCSTSMLSWLVHTSELLF